MAGYVIEFYTSFGQLRHTLRAQPITSGSCSNSFRVGKSYTFVRRAHAGAEQAGIDTRRQVKSVAPPFNPIELHILSFIRRWGFASRNAGLIFEHMSILRFVIRRMGEAPIAHSTLAKDTP
ncbi:MULTISPECIES: hypothetical protein [unclassified Duganella]|uniref:hypothetical protein n=1 Tax=unclassified Duganella TaxID=2636909 RepID=UPI0012E3F8E4|nr:MULTISPECIES: hypothetical protein [unclassified Duganella]